MITLDSQQFLQSKHLFNFNEKIAIAGLDEVGRGPLAGPVVSCAVVIESSNASQLEKDLPLFVEEMSLLGVNDSKKISTAKRKKILRLLNIQNEKGEIKISPLFQSKIYYSIAFLPPTVIDEINILQASLKSMSMAWEDLRERTVSAKQALLLIDGNQLPRFHEKVTAIPLVKGDSKSKLIALASLIAKEFRDNLMNRLHEEFPYYGWNSNAGYPTKIHQEGIKKHGITEHHRKSFRGVGAGL